MKNIFSIVLATRNQNKIDEIKKFLDLDINYRTLSDYIDISIQEAGRTLIENSLAKASFAFKISRIPSLADDSGLFVSSLNDSPGVFSARYGKNDDERIKRLLNEMKDKQDRRAEFRAVFVYYSGVNEYKIFKGICAGEIAAQPRGSEGFGYDPIFIPHGYLKTFAELGLKTKNRISHRARALAKFKKYYLNYLM